MARSCLPGPGEGVIEDPDDVAGHVRGPHIGHPILRCRKKYPTTQRPWWVCVGRLAACEDDEVWTKSRRFLRSIRQVLQEDQGWWDSYLSSGNLVYDKPFVIKAIAERELNEAVNLADLHESKLTCTMMSEMEAVMTNGLLTERLFDLLVEEGVLRHPWVREFRPVTRLGPVNKSECRERPVSRSQVWMVDQAQADLWLSTRLLLLDMNRPE